MDKAVDIDNSGSVAELHASHEHEDEGDYRVDGLQHLRVAGFPRRHICEGRGKLGFGQVDLSKPETEPEPEEAVTVGSGKWNGTESVAGICAVWCFGVTASRKCEGLFYYYFRFSLVASASASLLLSIITVPANAAVCVSFLFD